MLTWDQVKPYFVVIGSAALFCALSGYFAGCAIHRSDYVGVRSEATFYGKQIENVQKERNDALTAKQVAEKELIEAQVKRAELKAQLDNFEERLKKKITEWDTVRALLEKEKLELKNQLEKCKEDLKKGMGL